MKGPPALPAVDVPAHPRTTRACSVLLLPPLAAAFSGLSGEHATSTPPRSKALSDGWGCTRTAGSGVRGMGSSARGACISHCAVPLSPAPTPHTRTACSKDVLTPHAHTHTSALIAHSQCAPLLLSRVQRRRTESSAPPSTTRGSLSEAGRAQGGSVRSLACEDALDRVVTSAAGGSARALPRTGSRFDMPGTFLLCWAQRRRVE